MESSANTERWFYYLENYDPAVADFMGEKINRLIAEIRSHSPLTVIERSCPSRLGVTSVPHNVPHKHPFPGYSPSFAGLRFSGNPARTKASEHMRRSRLKLGVKGSQVQILSARLGSRAACRMEFPTGFPI
jgi:hypothetical protein